MQVTGINNGARPTPLKWRGRFELVYFLCAHYSPSKYILVCERLHLYYLLYRTDDTLVIDCIN